MFIDKVTIKIKSGNGGNGSVSFHREKFVAKGGPDGGDGGRGGDVIFEIDKGETTLLGFKTRRNFKASAGGDGKGGKIHGANGPGVTIKVPEGTLIRDAASGQIIKDMSGCEPFVAAKGGKGGWGNRHFATPTRQTPNFAKSGLPGVERELVLELKMLADVGLVGFPNAGKSSLLAAVSSARPKIASYRFTTLAPNLGVINLGEGRSFVMADIPGLIEGASQGLGLGHNFLRHIERCRMLIHVVDVAGTEGRDPVEDVDVINGELIDFNPELLSRPQIIAANKIDTLDEGFTSSELEEYARDRDFQVAYISAYTGQGIDELMERVLTMLQTLPPVKVYDNEYVEPTPEITSSQEVTVTRHNDVFVVEADWLLKVMNSINYNDYESLQYFQKVLRNSGVIDRLVEAGAKDGDTVSIYDFEFDFVV